MPKKKNTTKKNSTKVLVKFPEKIETHLVQSNELKQYEVFQWLTALVAPIAAGFWTAYFTSNRPWPLFWSAVAFTLMAFVFAWIAIRQRRKVYGSNINKATDLDSFTHYLEDHEVG